MDAPWWIEMLGGLRATQGDHVVSRFRSHRHAALLAYLAYYCSRAHPRESLMELLWPQTDPKVGRNNLRVALSMLRRQLEPPGVAAGAVIVAGRTTVQLNPAACITDVARFEAALQAAHRAASPTEQVRHFTSAVEQYRGELLPGCLDEWVLQERQRLLEAYLQALHTLVTLHEHAGDSSQALLCARRAVAADPLREESHHDLLDLLIAAGQTEAALRQYQDLERLLTLELGVTPSPELRALGRRLDDRSPRPVDSNHGSARPDAERVRGSARRTQKPRSAASSPIEHASPPLEARLPSPAGYLPLQLTRFFGREQEIKKLHALLQPSALTEHPARLVTLTGPGGTGKTRLALAVGRRVQEHFPGGVWFVRLLDLVDACLIPAQILRSMRLTLSPQMSPMEQVAIFFNQGMSGRPALLLLDNFEQLLEGGARLLQELLERVESLTLLVTSRQRLGLDGEREFPVGPLATPGVGRRVLGVGCHMVPDAQHPTPNTLLRFPSVALFLDRAQAVRPDFQLTARNAAAVASLCARLEGLPLALELAAARVWVLTPVQMLERLTQRFELLVARNRAADPRHQSFRATLDWSYQLLTPELQRFFARLSVFRGGWTLEAAEAVCEEPQALEYLEQLRDASLVLAEAGEIEIRFRLLEMLRAYGAEQLSAQERSDLSRRHAAYFLALAEQGERELWGPDKMAWLDRLEREHHNMRAVFDWAEERGEALMGLRLAGALVWFWIRRNYLTEGRARLERLLALDQGTRRQTVGVGESSISEGGAKDVRSVTHSVSTQAPCSTPDGWKATRIKALAGAGYLCSLLGDPDSARRLLEQSVGMAREVGDRRLLAGTLGSHGALGLLARAALESGDLAAARPLLEEALAIGQQLGDKWIMTCALQGLGHVCGGEGNPAAAQDYYERRLALCRELDDPWGCGMALLCLGLTAYTRGDPKAGRALCEESLVLFRQLGTKLGIAELLDILGRDARREHDCQRAAVLLGESLTLYQELGHWRCLGFCLEDFAGIAATEAEALSGSEAEASVLRAARLFGAAEALIGDAAIDQAEHDRLVAATRAALGDAAADQAWAQGRAMPLECALAFAVEKYQG